MDVIQNPRGPDKGRLWQVLWERMTEEFRHVCHHMNMGAVVTEQAITNLRSYNHFFTKGEVRLVGGVHTPHILRRRKAKHEGSKSGGNARRSHGTKEAGVTVTDSATSDGTSSDSNIHPGNDIPTSITIQIGTPKRKGVWKRLFGWTKA